MCYVFCLFVWVLWLYFNLGVMCVVCARSAVCVVVCVFVCVCEEQEDGERFLCARKHSFIQAR